MRKFAITAAIAAAVVSAPAFAAKSGPYLGSGVTHDSFATGGDIEGVGFDGVGATVFAGYDLAVSESTFVGVEANFDLSSAKAGDDTDYVKLNHQFGLSARAGLNLNDSTALYGRLGFQRARGTVVDGADKVSESRNGVRFGGGVETLVSGNIKLRAEYNRSHYSLTDAEEAELAPLEGGYNNNQFLLGAVFGF